MKRKILALIVAVALAGVALFQAIPALADTPNPIDHVVISPSSTTLPPGGLCQFSAQAYDAGNQALSNVTYFWMVTLGPGTISNTGLFTASTTPGSYTSTVQVVAVQGGLVKLATAPITVTAIGVPHITVTPANVTLAPNGTQQFMAQLYDANNVPVATTFTWSVIGAGSVNATGFFTAGAAPGTSTVQASAVLGVTVTGTATVKVVGTPVRPVNIDTNRLMRMFNAYLKCLGFENFLGGQWQVKTATGIDTIKVIPGVVQTAPSAVSLVMTVLPNGQSVATTFTLPSMNVIRPKDATLHANDRVIVVTVNDQVKLVVKIAAATIPTQVPPGLRKHDNDKREGKQTPPGWSRGNKTGWDKDWYDNDDDDEDEDDD